MREVRGRESRVFASAIDFMRLIYRRCPGLVETCVRLNAWALRGARTVVDLVLFGGYAYGKD